MVVVCVVEIAAVAIDVEVVIGKFDCSDLLLFVWLGGFEDADVVVVVFVVELLVPELLDVTGPDSNTGEETKRTWEGSIGDEVSLLELLFTFDELLLFLDESVVVVFVQDFVHNGS